MTGKRVLVAMSGGVDSSVTAHLLMQAGYECEGATMRLTCSRSFGEVGPKSCCSLSDIADAEAVCAKLGIPHRVLDMREIFERRVVDKFVATYEDGRTPNPCIDCNRYLKFGALLDWALEQGFDYVATGHYAQVGTLGDALARAHVAAGEGNDAAHASISAENTAPQSAGAKADSSVDTLARLAQICGPHTPALSLGVDASKDQSYVLYSLAQERLEHVILPLGGLVKEHDVRPRAHNLGLVNAEKPDSQGICFVPDDDFAAYIERRRGALLPEGDVIDTAGNVLGRHQGAIRYTVGQRKGLGVAMLHPMYVCAVDAAANTVTLGENEDLMAASLTAGDWIWSAPATGMRELLDAAGPAGLPVTAKIRYHQPAQAARLSWADAAEISGSAGRGEAGPSAAVAADGAGATAASLEPGHEPRALRLDFAVPQRAIAPGQAVVVYAGDVVLGGGTTLR